MQIYKNKTHKKIIKKYVQNANNFDVFFKKIQNELEFIEDV